jgi:hypothetical protein
MVRGSVTSTENAAARGRKRQPNTVRHAEPPKHRYSVRPLRTSAGQLASGLTVVSVVMTAAPCRTLQATPCTSSAWRETGRRQTGRRQTGRRETGRRRQVGARQVGARQVGARQVGARQVGARQVGARQVGARQVGAIQGRRESGWRESGWRQTGRRQTGRRQTGWRQVGARHRLALGSMPSAATNPAAVSPHRANTWRTLFASHVSEPTSNGPPSRTISQRSASVVCLASLILWTLRANSLCTHVGMSVTSPVAAQAIASIAHPWWESGIERCPSVRVTPSSLVRSSVGVVIASVPFVSYVSFGSIRGASTQVGCAPPLPVGGSPDAG